MKINREQLDSLNRDKEALRKGIVIIHDDGAEVVEMVDDLPQEIFALLKYGLSND